MTGNELLEKLQALSDEERELPVYSCDGYGDLDELADIAITDDQFRKIKYINVVA